jgi:hypothetical protein
VKNRTGAFLNDAPGGSFHGPRGTERRAGNMSRGCSPFAAAETARGVLADFVFLMEKLGALLGEFFAAAMLEMRHDEEFRGYWFHVDFTSWVRVAEGFVHCL